MDRQPADVEQGPVECVRCHCPECERERFLLWKLVELAIFQASNARGLDTKTHVFIKAWEQRPLNAKKPLPK